MNLLIATPSYGGILTTGYFNSFLKTMAQLSGSNVNVSVMVDDRDALISRSRNKLATFALESKRIDKMLFIDSDIVWTPNDVLLLLASKKDIIGGVYSYKKFPINPVVNGLSEKSELNKDGEVEVKTLPCGFMMIDVSIFKSLSKRTQKYKFFDEVDQTHKFIYDFFPIGINEDEVYNTEDWGFCDIARKDGNKVWLHTKVKLGHIGSHEYKLDLTN